MAEPLTQTERQLKDHDERLEKLEQAVEKMVAISMGEVQSHDFEEVRAILKPDTGSAEPGWPDKN